jgi:trigger factor
VRKDLEEQASRESDAGVRQQLVDHIAAANPFDVPASWVNQTIDGYMQAYEVPDADKEQFRPIAERQVRRDLIIDAIAEREGLKATEADIDDRVAEVATKRGADPGQVYASLQKAGRLREIEQGITEDKVYAWLIARNEIAS